MFDLVSVYHNDRNFKQFCQLECDLRLYADMDYTLYGVDNREENRGFAAGCNVGASWGSNPIVGLLNPDVRVNGPFLRTIHSVFDDPEIVVTGERFGKPHHELRVWGCDDWVCGAAMFVRRDWWDLLDGFDERFTWGWEETDFIRRTQAQRKKVRSVGLPLEHQSPNDESPDDFAYKRKWFEVGAKRFRERWQ